MKRVKGFSVLMLAALFAMAFIWVEPAHAENTVYVSPSRSTGDVGGTFGIDIRISGVTNLYTASFTLNWNPTVLNYVNVLEGTFLRGTGISTYTINTTDQDTGMLDLAYSRLGAVAGVTGNGILMFITFYVETAGATSLSLSQVSLIDSTGTAIPGPYTVISGYFAPGDSNVDGAIDVFDLATVALAYAPSTPGGTPVTVTKSPSTSVVGWTTPANVYYEDDVYSSTATAGLKNTLGGYGFSMDEIGIVTKVEIGIEGYCATAGNYVGVTFSFDGGKTFPFATTIEYAVNPLPTTDTNTVIWTDVTAVQPNFANTLLRDDNFRVQVIKRGTGGTVYLDWVPVRVTYIPTSWTSIDWNRSGYVDIMDLAILAKFYGS